MVIIVENVFSMPREGQSLSRILYTCTIDKKKMCHNTYPFIKEAMSKHTIITKVTTIAKAQIGLILVIYLRESNCLKGISFAINLCELYFSKDALKTFDADPVPDVAH